jgi:hypothetical protein
MPNDIETIVRDALNELTTATPIANPEHPRDHMTASAGAGGVRPWRDFKVLAIAVGVLALLAVFIGIGVQHQSNHPSHSGVANSTTTTTTTSLPPLGNIAVPNVVGLSTESAAGELRSAGLSNSVDNVNCGGSIARGTVAGQSPAAGFRAAPASRVNLRIVCAGSPSATTPTTAEPSTTSSSTASTAAAGFTAAKQQWVQAASSISAEQGVYWVQAASDLSSAITAGGIDAFQYRTAIGQLQQLASIPETSDTPAQMMEAHSDVAALNTFFGTPNLYS